MIQFRRGRKATTDTEANGPHSQRCDQCDSSFALHKNLLKHKRVVHIERKFVCTQCKFAAKAPSVLKVHMRQHTGERPFPCEHCFFAAKTKQCLQDHTDSVHSEERPFNCLQCSATFKTKHILFVTSVAVVAFLKLSLCTSVKRLSLNWRHSYSLWPRTQLSQR